ncbi:LytR/AlgR family response regulator transcription factor [Massilia sp. S19_KUP03_FR1]|uniref:LytR/AlgR family response regulator transcription factor n=1 Tax=Massilia sp. S19_KUP03_FR1 TaxID=3025503 RepID=UPI002FCD8225
MRVIIVDDEHLARVVLREYLRQHADIEIVAECANGFEAVKAIAQLAPDLVFLDIQMPKLDGFEVAELAGAKVQYVFVTAFDQFALRAFEVHAIDYLLKPFSQARFDQALAHARARAPANAGPMLADAAQRHGPVTRVLIRDGAQVHVVPAADIDTVEAQDDYINITVGAKSWLKHASLSELESQLDPAAFVRIHRSWIVALRAVARIEPVTKDTYCAVLNSGARLPVSRTGYPKLRQLLR